MNDHNLDDLIIGEPQGKSGKSKSVLTLLALILIILIVGTVLVKLITGGEEESKSPAETELSSVVRPGMHASRPETKTPREQIPEDLQPIVDEKLPPLPSEKPIAHKTSTPAQAAPVRHAQAPKPAVRHPRPAQPKQTPAPVRKASAAPVHKSTTHPKAKSASKPSELFHKSSGNKIYYIQVGSFRRPPTQKFLDKIQAAGYTPVIVKNSGMTKVRIGPYPSYGDAKAKLPEIKSKIGIAGFVVRKK